MNVFGAVWESVCPPIFSVCLSIRSDVSLRILVLTIKRTSPGFDSPRKEEFLKSISGSGENAETSIFSFSHNVFFPLSKTEIIISATFLSSANTLSFFKAKILSSGNNVTLYQTLHVLMILRKNQHIFLLPQCFLTHKRQILPFEQ